MEEHDGEEPAGRGRARNPRGGRGNAANAWRNRDNDGPARRRVPQLQHQQPRAHRGFQPHDDRLHGNPERRNYYNDGGNFRRNNQPNNRNDRLNNRNDRPNDRYDNDRQERNVRFIGFRAIEELAQTDNKEIIVKVNEKRDSFLQLIESPIDRLDIFVLIMEVISKVCQSPFDALKSKLLLDICNSRFIPNLRNYLMDLPFPELKARNNLYWNNQEQFWINFVTFCDNIINISHSTVLLKCRSLIDGTSKLCLEELNTRHKFSLSQEYASKLAELRERLITREKEEMAVPRSVNEQFEESEPPENFRQLSVVPTREDLTEHRPYLRPNIVSGAYRDVEHYLDVQFRLLREDCFGPLRDGILQYVENPNRTKFDHIRVIRNVVFISPYISKNKIGSMIQLDEKTMKRFKRINWAHSKRFIFGSLLLFSKDDCKTFITATIIEREPKLLAKGQIPVSVMDSTNNLYTGEPYVMIESEVYFEPYFHVLKALQDPKFPEHIAMSKYIVNVDPEPKPPSYVTRESVYSIQTENSANTKFKVLEDLTWPSKEELGFNWSQYEAYKLALSHEFAVIQGPPGTGKTFIGVKVAKTLLENLKPEKNSCVLLVICYTNHALDQFLEAIFPVTKSMVRIGGQSRNEAMEKINLTTLRKSSKVPHQSNRLFYDQRNYLTRAVNEMKIAYDSLESLNHVVISFESLNFLPEVQVLGQYYSENRGNVRTDPLKHWLFENMQYANLDVVLRQEKENIAEVQAGNAIDDDDLHQRIETILDDFGDENDREDHVILNENIKTSFNVVESKKNIREMVMLYHKCESRVKKQELQHEIISLESHIHMFNEMMANVRNTRLHVRGMDLSRVSTIDRWSLYCRWKDVVYNKMKMRLLPLQKALETANTAYEEARMMVDLNILQNVKVIGMTTSGAARLRKLLLALAPPIVIVEEAAEVLEQHIVTSLTKNCEHLILIGDHQQLRPSAAHMRLARHFNIEVSLFERMITNGMHSRRLGVQHRMRPEIAALISPHIYQDLANHPSVEGFLKVRGMSDNMFFFTHKHQEENIDDSSSRSNQFEADMTLRLANYIMQQGYQPEDVTILAAYSGQMFYMRKQRDKFAYLSKVKITVVDNYQGEESKIILLSLVRNNSSNKIGFLGTDNRVCVALSRAREGFYILGNIDILKNNSELWRKIAETLENNRSLGTSLMLKCESHPSEITTISSLEDFEKVPEGGCRLMCNTNLPCHHPCRMICHAYDRGHVNVKCYQKCEREICGMGHPCPLVCGEKCKPCKVKVQKLLPCGHTMMVFCHIEATDPTLKCKVLVSAILPNCKHETKKHCYQKVESVVCLVPCEYRVPCGHMCRLRCHVTEDPEHEKYLCEKPCGKAKAGCSLPEDADNRDDHQCTQKCYQTCDECKVEITKKRSKCKHSEQVACNENVNDKPCPKNCAKMLDCGHHCKNKCFEPCGDCEQMVKKLIPECGHTIQVTCMTPATRKLCIKNCERILSCGHPCGGRCSQICDPSTCSQPISLQFTSPCGHQVILPCNIHQMRGSAVAPEDLLRHCTEPCRLTLECGHACGGTCGTCHQGRLHEPCRQPCHQINICGHQCNEPCNQVCPPCGMPCEIKCPHSRCNELCGAPCVPCKEKCSLACPHGACSRLCGEACSRPPCDEPCTKALACGHRCRGLCGEPCPNICRQCRPQDFPKDFLGDDYEEDTKFVQLQDCHHVLDVENMDNLMKGDTESITIRSCPFCRKPIINTYRYKDLVNKMIKNDINPIKSRVHGTEVKIKTKKDELIKEVNAFVTEHETTLEEVRHLKTAYIKLSTAVKTQKKVTLLKLQMQFQYLNILDMLREFYQKYKDANVTALRPELLDLINMICLVLVDNSQKISRQLQMDIGNEMKRINSVIQLSQILSHSSYFSIQTVSEVQKAVEASRSVVLTWRTFQEQNALEALNQLQKSVNVFGIVSKQERDLIVQAIGSKAGSWYKCPNGHYYSIANCGGAVVVSRCADCGVAIGGTSYRLLGDNSHAGEVDGSAHAAW